MSKPPEKRGNWYLLTGLVLGVVLGLVYAWVVSPVVYVDAGPYSLREDFKDQYRLLVALAYLADNNFPRAQARLHQLDDPEIGKTIARQAQRAEADAHPDLETRALGQLALALGGGPTPTVTKQPAQDTATPQLTATSTPTPVLANPTASLSTESVEQNPASRTLQPSATLLPSRTPTATIGAPFLLQEQTLVCSPEQTVPLLQVIVLDAAGEQVPGVEVIVTWEVNEEHFFTGLKPELGMGYADFEMSPDQMYVLRLADGGQPVSDLVTSECEGEGGDRYYGSWMLVFSAIGR
jgi:hypothetical protein